MKIISKNINLNFLYIFFISLSLNLFFFSTIKTEAKSFDIENIDISRPFEINFNKNDVINDGFEKAFLELIRLTVNSTDEEKLKNIQLNDIKAMIESFTIKEEKFINEVYYVNLGVSFNKKKFFTYLENKNIFPSLPLKKNFLFIPIIIDEKKRDLLIFYNNKIFNKWNEISESYHLIQYVLPTEDLEDLNIIKKKFEVIEEYNFQEIIKKYDLNNSIVTLIFRDKNDLRILSRIINNNNVVLKNLSFENFDLENDKQIELLIKNLKMVYEDYWKNLNQINTSIKLNLIIKVSNKDSIKISNFEKKLVETDLIYDFSIKKFDKDFTFYEIIFNGTPDNFIKNMNNMNYNFNTQNKIWVLK